MKRLMQAVALSGLFLATACHHATIETGLAPSQQTIHQKFATGWLFGLIPPKTVNAASTCPQGVARVETQQSFLNGLVSGITFGIYSPMEIKVTCAAGGQTGMAPGAETINVGAAQDASAVQDAFAAAAERAVETKEPVLVQF